MQLLHLLSQLRDKHFAILCLAILFCGCKKEKPQPEPLITTELTAGLPENIRAVNGYFLSSFDYLQLHISATAAFNDPRTDFTTRYNHEIDYSGTINAGNVDVGSVWFDGFILDKNTSASSLAFSLPPPSSFGFSTTVPSAIWKTYGNDTFEPLELTVTRGYPIIVNLYNVTSYPLKISNGMKIDVKNMISNYDSVIVMIENYNYRSIRKSVPAGVDSIYFTSNELTVLQGSAYGQLKIYACNYSNRIIKNISYVFELINKQNVALTINP